MFPEFSVSKTGRSYSKCQTYCRFTPLKPVMSFDLAEYRFKYYELLRHVCIQCRSCKQWNLSFHVRMPEFPTAPLINTLSFTYKMYYSKSTFSYCFQKCKSLKIVFYRRVSCIRRFVYNAFHIAIFFLSASHC